jgi:hypothetical protein
MARTTSKPKKTSRKNVEAAPMTDRPSLAFVIPEPAALAAPTAAETETPQLEPAVAAANDIGSLDEMFRSTCARIRELSNVLARAEETFAAKLLYEEIHPETRQGGAAGKAGGGKIAKTATVATFVDAIARETFRSPRAVRLDVEIVTHLGADAATRLRDTPIASQTTVLHAIASLPENLQAEVTTSYVVARDAEGDEAGDRVLKAALSSARPPRTPRSPVAPLLDRARLRVPIGETRDVAYGGRLLRIGVTGVTGDRVRLAVEIVEIETAEA